MIINESLRIYPIVVLWLLSVSVTRAVKKDVKSEKPCSSNLNILIRALVLLHNPLILGKDVQLSKPERFEGVSKATKNNRQVFLPFGLRPRTCVD